MNNVRNVRRYWGANHSLHRGDPNILICDQLMLRDSVRRMGITWQHPAACLSRHIMTRQKVCDFVLYRRGGVIKTS